jgi:hypothetical protein
MSPKSLDARTMRDGAKTTLSTPSAAHSSRVGDGRDKEARDASSENPRAHPFKDRSAHYAPNRLRRTHNIWSRPEGHLASVMRPLLPVPANAAVLESRRLSGAAPSTTVGVPRI